MQCTLHTHGRAPVRRPHPIAPIGPSLSLYGRTGVLGSGRSPLVRPTVQARDASLWCLSTSAICTLGQNLVHCPLTHGCHRPPRGMPNPGIDPMAFQLRDLRLARVS